MSEYAYAGSALRSEISLELPAATNDTCGPWVQVRRLAEHVSDLPAYTSYAVRGWQCGRPVALGRTQGEWVAWLPPYLTAYLASELIEIQPFPGVHDDKLNEHIVGNVLPFWLAATGRWSLHGSAASHSELGCVAVLGPTHSGKSTTVALLVADGWDLISDDTMTGRIVEGRVMLDSTSDTVHLRGLATPLVDSDGLVRARPDSEGRETATTSYAPHPVALDRLLFLSADADPTYGATPISTALSVKRLLDNSRVAAWIDEELRTYEFEAAADIASVVPSFEIAAPTRFKSLEGYAGYIRRIVGAD